MVSLPGASVAKWANALLSMTTEAPGFSSYHCSPGSGLGMGHMCRSFTVGVGQWCPLDTSPPVKRSDRTLQH